MNIKLIFLFSLLFIYVYAEPGHELYFNNLKEIKKIEDAINNELPVLYNQMCQAGYFAMPSARMANAGVIACGYSNSDPYQILGINLQYFDHLELSANFWIYKNVLEGAFGHMGYGEDADRAANFKVSIHRRGDGFEALPEIALGINDFYGSKRFRSKYIVFTKQFIDKHFECSIGYGTGRIKGFFAGCSYFSSFRNKYLIDSMSVFAEYDANNYKKYQKEHPKGRKVKCPINIGLNCQFLKIFQGSISTLRGDKIAASISANYNLGQTRGLFPKYLDPPVYSDFNKILFEDTFANNLAKAFKDQSLDLMRASINLSEKNEKCLLLNIMNIKYRSKETLRLRIQNILTFFPLTDYHSIIIRVESDGLLLHEYKFKNKYLCAFKERQMGSYELQALCPLKDVSSAQNKNFSKIIYEKKKKVWQLTIRPKINTFFSSCKGKFKNDAGFLACQEGYFFNQLYYNLQASYIIKSSSAQVGSRDKYNPSQIINVRSDFTKYFETNTFHIDNAYLQKNWNLKKAFFAKISLGYFEVAYGGIAGEILYYPINSIFACSLEAANVYKRKYGGLDFQEKIRKFKGDKEEFEKYIGFQYFLNLFYEIEPLNLTLKTSIGQFLAKDKGIKFELSRYFKSGLEVSTWITFTNGGDVVNRKRYFDKGFSIILPLDIFMNKSSRKKVTYKMSEWLRDVGAKASTGKELYPIIHDERYFP